MPDFSDLESLRKYLESNMQQVLEKEVFEAIREEMIKTIDDEVYGKYNPTGINKYVRKESQGGLKDPANIKGYMINGKLYVRNERKDWEGTKPGAIGTPRNDRSVAEAVEYGTRYEWADSKMYQSPIARPFMKMTTYRLQGNSKHIIAMIRGLKSRGIEAVMG